MTPLKFHIETYGCQMNVSDSELMHGVLAKNGMTPTDKLEEADLILLNTCAIRDHAEQRILGRVSHINKLKQQNKDLIIGVTGCMAQRIGGQLLKKAPYIDLVLGPDGYRHLPELIAGVRQTHQQQSWLRLDEAENYDGMMPVRANGPHAWITIMRGCNKACTFCIVPYVRGVEKCRPHQQILDEARTLAAGGVKEITLLGQTVNAYTDGTANFAQLLRLLNDTDGLERIRFTSPHPYEMTDEAMLAMAECAKVCEHLHFPVQSGSNRMLKRMVRLYKIEDYLAQIKRLRELMPTIGLTTDIIVGFPGETDEDFQMTVDLMQEVKYHTSFMFKYSYREGTPAKHFLKEAVPDEVAQERLEKVIALQREQTFERGRSLIGQTFEVMVEGDAQREGQSAGRTRQNQTVVFAKNGEQPGDLARVKIKETSGWTLIGEKITDAANLQTERLS